MKLHKKKYRKLSLFLKIKIFVYLQRKIKTRIIIKTKLVLLVEKNHNNYKILRIVVNQI
jgi:hypothetical protein